MNKTEVYRIDDRHALINQKLVITTYRFDGSIWKETYLTFDECKKLGIDMLSFEGKSL